MLGRVDSCDQQHLVDEFITGRIVQENTMQHPLTDAQIAEQPARRSSIPTKISFKSRRGRTDGAYLCYGLISSVEPHWPTFRSRIVLRNLNV
jgi:hypothetical protein